MFPPNSRFRLLTAVSMATSFPALSISSGSHFKSDGSTKLNPSGHHSSRLAFQKRSKLIGYVQPNRKLSVGAESNEGTRGGGGGDFLAGFLLGGAVFSTLVYIFAPQIRRSILNEDEYGFRKARRPIYYDEGLENTRQTLNAKISQLNAAIDNVSSQLRRGNNAVREPVETDLEVEAPM